jgi:hypothetical protein
LSQSGPASLGSKELVTRVRKGRSKLGDEAGKARVRRRPWLVRGQQYLRLQRHCRSRGRMRRPQQRREYADQETERAAGQQPRTIEPDRYQGRFPPSRSSGSFLFENPDDLELLVRR